MHQGSGWITQERLKIYGQAIFLAELLGILLQLVFRWLSPDFRSIIVPASDFRVFWAASQLALQGDPIGAFDLDRIFAAIQASDPSITLKYPWFGWFYPPTFLLAILPLALLSCSQAFVLFVGSSLAAYVALLNRIARPFPVRWLILAFAPVIFAVYNGQNALLTATLSGIALTQLDRRPTLAGVCIGLLAIKPQLAVLFPIALASGQHWRAFWTAAVTVACFLGASVAVLGIDTVPAFIGGIAAARAAVFTADWPLMKMPSLYASALAVHADKSIAELFHLVGALCASLTVIWCWRQDLPVNIRNSAFILATLLVSPHLFDYDLTWLALPIIWMALEGVGKGWLPGERTALVCAWMAPLVLGGLAELIGPNFTPIVLVVLLGYSVQRGRLHLRVARPVTVIQTVVRY